jgi:hypothetical protein
MSKIGAHRMFTTKYPANPFLGDNLLVFIPDQSYVIGFSQCFGSAESAFDGSSGSGLRMRIQKGASLPKKEEKLSLRTRKKKN